jgi:hypothetical protein
METYNLPIRKIVVLVYQDSIYRRMYIPSTLPIHQFIFNRFDYVFDSYFRRGYRSVSKFNIMLR